MWTMLRVAATGIRTQQGALDVAANNLANVDTTGFKARRAALIDLPPGAGDFGGQEAPVGQGVTLEAVLPNPAPGPLQSTGRPLDLAIDGPGFLQVALPDGGTAYTRDGNLQVDALGRLGVAAGPLVPPITVPAGATGLVVEADGTVVVGSGTPQRRELGRLTLASFTNPDGLEATGRNLLLATAASGEPTVGAPGTPGLGRLVPGSLETSNVDVAEEITRVLRAQRAYQVSLRALQTADELLREANDLRR